jgi:hypothetical protein
MLEPQHCRTKRKTVQHAVLNFSTSDGPARGGAGQENQMRKQSSQLTTTLDGCVDHTRQVADDETHEYFTDLLREVDLLVFGRITYQLMVPFWPEVAKTSR